VGIALIHYTLNTARSVDSPRSAQGLPALESLGPLVVRGGFIPNHSPFRTTVLHGHGSTVFTVHRGREAITHSVVAWTQAGETIAWTTIENLFITEAFRVPALVARGTVSEMPLSLPWVSVVLLQAMAYQPRDTVLWLGDFERCLAWAIVTERSSSQGS